MKRILVLTPALYNTAPGPRFRIEQWARHLEPEGFEFSFMPFEDEALHEVIYHRGSHGQKAALMFRAIARRLGVLALVRDFDVVFIYTGAASVGPPLLERMIARQGVPTVFDFDDAVWVPHKSPTNGRLSYLKWFGKTAAICRLSNHVIAGNSYLARYARRYNANVTVVPSTIDTDAYVLRPIRGSEDCPRPVTIGWMGSHSTVQHLDTLRGALRKLRQHREFRLHVIGAPDYRLDGVETIAQEWRAESEAQDLLLFDMGIMPLPDDAWSRGKCGMKLLQYMGMGVPAVGSPVGVNSEIIEDGVNGFLASSEEEWIAKLSGLIGDSSLRRRIGLAGRQTVEERYSARAWASKVRTVLESAAAQLRKGDLSVRGSH